MQATRHCGRDRLESLQTILLLIGAVCIRWCLLSESVVGRNWRASSPRTPTPLAGGEAYPKARLTFSTMARDASDASGFSLVFGHPGLSGARHLVLVLRPDDSSARAGPPATKTGPAGPALLRLIKILPVFHLRPARRNLRSPSAARLFRRGRPGKGGRHLPPSCSCNLLPSASRACGGRHACRRDANLLRGATPPATLFAYDIVKRLGGRPRNDHNWCWSAKSPRRGHGVSIVMSPLFGHYNTIFRGH